MKHVDAASICGRLDRLERENRRLRLAVLVLLLLVGAMFLLGAARDQPMERVIEADKIILKSDGKTTQITPGLVHTFQNDRASGDYKSALISLEGMAVTKGNKLTRAHNQILLAGDLLSLQGDSPLISVTDDSGAHATLGSVTTTDARTGARIQYPASTVILVNKDGGVLHQLP